ncbi:WD40 repeat domain-containing protein [Naegleria gruberi]|uniref:WD40 repeat domain-containing protein n=2 Tax=Naegleria gruberi TaxID=5762 RepID=D2VKD4_NAEGR|nr:WD40 repeat domain-containing protein [Naegleria gruberi]EFC42667.1 WD40 repeat domain-containing protein [Naegleria gruberi]|eukprot:XP_002675411.1 WD40 repeat domain-containing protein [Naegleria gruberi strain NEG-M]
MSISLQNVYGGVPNTERGRPTFISAAPASKSGKFTYGSGTNVLIRDLNNLLSIDYYTQHTHKVNVAKFAPTGFYIASGDESGNVRIWSTENADKTIKLEKRVLSKSVRDLAWTGDSQRVVAVGDGKQEYGAVFAYDMGTNTGEISAHSKEVLTCDSRPERPFRIATGGADLSLNFFTGPPFKFSHSNKDHERFINCIRYSPDGSTFASCSSDKKVIFFEGKTGEKLGELSQTNGHKLSIYGLSYLDNKHIVTASGDKSVKLWNIDTKECVATTVIGDSTNDIQVGVSVIAGVPVSISLNGDLNVLSKDCTRVERKILGHNARVNKIVVDKKSGGKFFYTCSTGGQLIKWEVGVGSVAKVQGNGHQDVTINTMAIAGDKLITAAQNNEVRLVNLSDFTYVGDATTLLGSPNDVSVSADGNLVAISTHVGATLLSADGKILSEVKIDKDPQSISIKPDGSEIAVGCKDKKIRVYKVAGQKIVDGATELAENTAKIQKVSYSPDGALLASADSAYDVVIFDTASWKPKYSNMTYHSSAVVDVDWSDDSKYMLTCSLDKNLIVWDLAAGKRVKTDMAHHLGVSTCAFIDSETFVSGGEDFMCKTWKFSV